MTNEERPLFSVWVLAYGPKAHLLSLTLDNLENQTFQDYEVLIADAREEKKEIPFSLAQVIEMPPFTKEEDRLKVLLECSKGRHVHILKAGEYYLSIHSLKWMAEALEAEGFPDFLGTGFILRHSLSPTEFLYYPLIKKNILRGFFPPQSACVWKKKILVELQPAPSYRDMLCKIVERGSKRAFLSRVLVDYIYQVPSPKNAILQVTETGGVLLRSFGPRPAFAMWSARIAWQFARWWLARIKKMFKPIV